MADQLVAPVDSCVEVFLLVLLEEQVIHLQLLLLKEIQVVLEVQVHQLILLVLEVEQVVLAVTLLLLQVELVG